MNGTEKLHHAPHDRLLVVYYLLLYSSLSFLCLREKSQETGFAIGDCCLFIIYNKITLLLFLRKLLVVSVRQGLFQTFIVAANSLSGFLMRCSSCLFAHYHPPSSTLFHKKLLLLDTVARISCIRVLKCCHI